MIEKICNILTFSLLFLFFLFYNVGRIFGLERGYLSVLALLGVFALLHFFRNPNIILGWRKWLSWQFVLISFMTLSLLWAINPLSLNYIIMMLILVLKVGIVAILCNTESKVKSLLLILSLVGFTVFIVLLKTDNLYAYRTTQITFLDNPNTFGLLCCIYITGAFYWFVQSTKKWQKILFFSLVLICLYMIMMTGGRKFLLFTFILVLSYYFFKKRFTIRHLLVAIILGYLMVNGLQYLMMKIPTLYDAIGYRFDTTLYYGTIEGSNDQKMLMKAALRAWIENPIVGLGPGGFQTYNQELGNLYSHSNYTELLANFGIIGFIIYYSVYIYCIKIFIKYRLRLDKYGMFLFALLVSIIFLETFSITYNQTAYIPLFIMFITTYCFKLHKKYKHEPNI